jgi:hypothetical protein
MSQLNELEATLKGEQRERRTLVRKKRKGSRKSPI